MALNTLNPGTRRLQVRGVLRLHDGVAKLPAELHRVCELVGSVAAHGAHQHEHESEANEKSKCVALSRDVEVKLGESRNHARLLLAPSPPFQQHAEGDEQKAQNQEGRGHHEAKHTDVRTGSNGNEVYKEEEGNRREAGCRNGRPNQADRIAEETDFGFFWSSWLRPISAHSVCSRHCPGDKNDGWVSKLAPYASFQSCNCAKAVSDQPEFLHQVQ